MMHLLRKYWLVPALLTVGLAASADGQSAPGSRLLGAGDLDTMPVRPGQRIAYGADSLQFGELRLPPAVAGRRSPVAIIIHGGCWISSFATLRNTAVLADALAQRGVATWNIEYRRADHPDGGWPGTFHDVAYAADYLRTLARMHAIDTTDVVVAGHSAGGHLALWLAARRSLPRHSALSVGTPLRIRAVISLGGVADLAEFAARPRTGCNRGVGLLLGGEPTTVPERLRDASPLARLPLGVPSIHIAGERDGIAPLAARNAFAAAAKAAGDEAQVLQVPGGHFEVIAPGTSAGATVIDRILATLGMAPGNSSNGQSLYRAPVAPQRQREPTGANDMKDNQLKALLKKTQAKASQAKKPARQAYDSTLEATKSKAEADDSDAKEIFKEMKRREF